MCIYLGGPTLKQVTEKCMQYMYMMCVSVIITVLKVWQVHQHVIKNMDLEQVATPKHTQRCCFNFHPFLRLILLKKVGDKKLLLLLQCNSLYAKVLNFKQRLFFYCSFVCFPSSNYYCPKIHSAKFSKSGLLKTWLGIRKISGYNPKIRLFLKMGNVFAFWGLRAHFRGSMPLMWSFAAL